MNNEYDLILTIINKGYADYVIDAAREAGASGGTIIYARGTNKNLDEKFLGISIQPEKEVVLTLVKHSEKNKIMKEICEKSNLDEKGNGICFSIPASRVVGITETIKAKNKKEDR